jgi:RNA polymerase sigma-70 factor (ECF subfamily)
VTSHSDSAGVYALQAAIAAVHARANDAASTDWHAASAMYTRLYELHPTPVVALNRAVAIAMSDGVEHGLAIIEGLQASGELDRYHLFHAAHADLLRRAGRFQQAAGAYDEAIALCENDVERAYLRRRLAEVIAADAPSSR